MLSKVIVHLEGSSLPSVYPEAFTFQKKSLICVCFVNKKGTRCVHKYPVDHIFRLTEEYPLTDHGEK